MPRDTAVRRVGAVTSVPDAASPAATLPQSRPPEPGPVRRVLQGMQIPIWSFAQVGVQMFVALLSARWLGPGDRGDLVLATTLATLLLLVSSLGAGNASRVLLAEPGRWWTWSRYVRLSFALALPHLLLSATVGLLILSRLSTADPAVAVAFVVYSAPALVAHLLREGLHGLGRHKSSLGIAVGNAGGQLLLITGAHLLGVLTPQAALYSFALCNTVSIAVQIAVGRAADLIGRELPPAGGREWWRQAGALLGFSRFALVAALGQSFVVNGDRLILGAYGSSAEVGIYAAASSLAQLTYVAPVALTALLTRRIAATGTLEPWRRMHGPVLVLSGVLAIAVAGLGWFAVPFLLGDDFTPARTILPILCLAGIPYASYHFDSAACAGLRDLRTGAWGALLGCAVLVLTATVGHHLLGTAGIAYGVLLTYTVMAVTARVRMVGRRTRGLATPAGTRP
jgi:O-antigen/teichoic acid export membrane protein